MTTRGIHLRATEARAAVNRLRWEIDLKVGVWPKVHEPNGFDYGEATGAIHEIAETIGILRNILDTIDEHVPADRRTSILTGQDIQAKLAGLIEHYVEYHRVGR